MSELTEDDRRLLSETIDRFAENSYSMERRRQIIDDPAGYSLSVWQEMADLGLLGLGVPSALGGIGGSVLELGSVMTAVGRHLMMEPYFSTAVMCAPLIAALDPEGGAFDLTDVFAGQHLLALAHAEPKLGFATGPIETRQTGLGVTGRKTFVLDSPLAHSLLVTALDLDGVLAVFLVSVDADGVAMRSARTVDGRWVADIDLIDAPATRLGHGDAAAPLRAAFDQGAVALAFEAAGSMTRLLNDTVEHIKTRRAFGGTLSQFQVLRHRAVEMFILLKETEAMALAAALACDGPAPERGRVAAAAKVHASRAARFVAESAVQLHGGLGVSDELAVSHHFKRMMMNEALLGNADHHLQRFIDLFNASEAA